MFCRAINSPAVKTTLVAEDSKRKARLSWYHPDDTVREPALPMMTNAAQNQAVRSVARLLLPIGLARHQWVCCAIRPPTLQAHMPGRLSAVTDSKACCKAPALYVQMVPRDWFKGGLLADLKYYKPFANSS